MAFTFVPPFNEGDKQTNPDTGVEYIYSDGAWRALGPKIEDEFDTLDDRYVKLNGTTDVGDLYRLRGPNAAGSGLSSFQNISNGEQKLYNMATPQDSNTGWAAPVGYVQSYVQNQIDSIPDVDLSGYLPLTGGKMSGAITFSSGSTTRSYLNFDNDQKANQTSEIVIQRPWSQDNKQGDRNGTGGLNLKIMANSDQNRLNIMTGSSANTTTLRITGGGNGKQIHSFSSIELCGGDAARQTIWAKSGIVGNLAYSGNADSNVRLSWGANKVWIKNAELDVTGNQIINVDEPTENHHAATRGYVDTQIAANSSEGVSVDRPPGLRFNFGNGTSAVGVSSFNYYSDNGQLKLRISLNSMDGKWHDGGKTQDFNYGAAQLFSIYGIPDAEHPDRWKIIRHGTFSRIDFHSTDVLVWVNSHYTNGSLTANEKYFVTLAGLF